MATHEELIKAGQFMINTYKGKHGDIDWSECTEVFEFDINHTSGFTCRWKDFFVIAFEGTHNKEGWQDNFTFNKQEMTFNGRPVKVHAGFKTLYYTASYYLREITSKDRKFLIVGHSQGGALASLCAMDFKARDPNADITCVTWGSPRVGGQAWKDLFNSSGIASFRYKYCNDFVCMVPTLWMNFVHVASKIHLDPGGSIFRRIFGNKDDHYPQKYFKAVKEMYMN